MHDVINPREWLEKAWLAAVVMTASIDYALDVKAFDSHCWFPPGSPK
jgi:hypothetical protein